MDLTFIQIDGYGGNLDSVTSTRSEITLVSKDREGIEIRKDICSNLLEKIASM